MPLFEDKKDNNPFIQPSQFSSEDLIIASKIQRRRLQILIHSRMYYKLDTNIISDEQFDSWMRELVQLQEDYPDISKKVCYAKAFKDWDASTGAFLPLDDAWIANKAGYILKLAEGQGMRIEYQESELTTGAGSGKSNTRKETIKQRSNTIPKGRRLF